MRLSRAARIRAARARAAYRSEGELCDAFTAEARREGYVVHAETSGWDLLLVDRDGLQVGVQAKLRPNCDVLAQALLGSADAPGPDVHAVLVPVPSPAFVAVAEELRLVIFTAADASPLSMSVSPAIRRITERDTWSPIRVTLERAQLWQHTRRAWTAPVEILGMGGGRPGPRQITPWKIAAVRLCRLLRARGHLLREDFNAARVSITWWITGPRAVLRSERIDSRRSRYVPTGEPLPDERWPEVAIALLDEPDVVAAVRYRRRRT